MLSHKYLLSCCCRRKSKKICFDLLDNESIDIKLMIQEEKTPTWY